MFIPTTTGEIQALGWDCLDVIIVSGDTYIDSPFNGAALISRVLLDTGYRVGIIAQPDLDSPRDISRLGEPVLCWGITGGCMDSMVANYTATKKFRKQDDLTPGGVNNRRPDRAVIQYANLIRRYFKKTAPLVLGGIEASLRRIAHYDYWDNRVRNSILFDAKAEILVYGMAEKTMLLLADRLKQQRDYRDLEGICFISKTAVDGYLVLPSAKSVKRDKSDFSRMFKTFYTHTEPGHARGLVQQQGERYLVQNPPRVYETATELDAIYNLPYRHDAHPFYRAMGKIPALDTIRFSITTHRGCYGECNFCTLAVHQGRTVRSRSAASIIKEAGYFTGLEGFNGVIRDVGGATANMYGIECEKKIKSGPCPSKRCLFPEVCGRLQPDHSRQKDLLKKLQQIKGIRKVFIASGIRYDMVLADRRHGENYLTEIISRHTSGQMKTAPEHSEKKILGLMGKQGIDSLNEFKKLFEKIKRQSGSRCFLTYYFIAAHPGCNLQAMAALKNYISSRLQLHPEQVQVFTPTPSTYSTLMYYTGEDPFSRQPLFVERDNRRKQEQKNILFTRHI